MTTKTPHSQVDKQSLQATLIQIRERAQNIEQLSEQNLVPKEFFRLFLDEVVAAMSATGGAVWIASSDGKLNLLAHSGDTTKNILKKLHSWDHHEELLQKVRSNSLCQMSSPAKGNIQDENSNPTDNLILFSPLKNNESCLGVVEIFQRPNNSKETQQGYLRFIEQMARLATRFLSNRKLRDLQDKQTVWKIADEFSRQVHASLDVKETSYDIANELRRLVQADRVTVTTKHKNKNAVSAISNLSQLDHRSNTVRQLIKLSKTVSETGQELDYQGDLEKINEHHKQVVQNYLEHSDSGSIHILPLFDGRSENTDSEEQPEVIGTLIIERKEKEFSNPEIESRLTVLQSHSALALSRALEHENLFMIPFLKTLGQMQSVKTLTRCPKWIVSTVLTVAAILTLCYYPIEFTVISPGTLAPLNQREVFASDIGVIDSLLVQNGDDVKKGQVLATLKNPELVMQKENIAGELIATQRSLSAAKVNLFNNRKSTPVEQDQLHAQVKQLEQSESSLLKQLTLFERKMEALVIKSPISGQIVTWDINKILNNRPVSRGQRLMTVADRTNSWNVELNMKEDDLGYLQKALENTDEKIKVTFTMATHPGEVFEGFVAEIHNQANEDKEGNRFVQVKVEVNSEGLPPLYSGAAIQGKIHCGEKSIGYVWFHDVIEFVQNKILFIM